MYRIPVLAASALCMRFSLEDGNIYVIKWMRGLESVIAKNEISDLWQD